MKKLLIVLIITVCAVSYGALSLNRHSGAVVGTADATVQNGYKQIATVLADATDLTTTTSYWDAIDDTFIDIPAHWNIVELSFYGYGDGTGAGTPANTTFSFIVYAARWHGNAKVVYQGTGVVGAQQMSINPVDGTSLNAGAVNSSYCWADTLASAGVADVWISDVILAGEGGNDNVATLSFDMNGYVGLWVSITDMTGQSVTSVTCVASGY